MGEVVRIDDYPELKKELWLRRLQAQRELGIISIGGEVCEVVDFPNKPEPPDDAA